MLCPLHGFGVAGSNMRAIIDQSFYNFQRGGETDVISIGFECQAQHGDALAFQNP